MLLQQVCVLLFLNLVLEVSSNASQLFKDVFKNYEAKLRPRKIPNMSVDVHVVFHISRLDNLDLRNQAVTTTGWLTITWMDDFLHWDPGMYDNITEFVVPASSVWLPDLALDNSAAEIYSGDHVDRFRVTVSHDGTIMWEPGGSFSTICEMNIVSYPFDEQTCDIIFATWHYTMNKVNLSADQGVLDIETYVENEEWELLSTSVSRKEWFLTNQPKNIYPEIWFTVHVRRRHLYYLVNIMLPCLMMSLLILVVFHLPPDSGEKVSLGVTVLLAFSVFQLLIAESVPSTSKKLPVFNIYLLFFMAESTFSVAVSVLVLNLHHRTEYKPPPRWLRKLVLDWMAMLVCRRKTNIVSETRMNESVHEMDENQLFHKESECVTVSYTINSSEQNQKNIPSVCIIDDMGTLTNELNPQPTVHDPATASNDISDLNDARHSFEDNCQTENLTKFQKSLTKPKFSSVTFNKVQPSKAAHGPSDTITNRVSTTSYDSHSADLLKQSDQEIHSGHDRERSSCQLSPGIARSAVKIMKSIMDLERTPYSRSRDDLLHILRDTYAEIMNKRENDEMDALFENEWKRIAEIVDKFFFNITLMLILISSIAIFCF